MDEKYWKQFEVSGKIEDYLSFAAMRDGVDGREESDRTGTGAQPYEAGDNHNSTRNTSGETGQSCRNIFM